jgi:predicted dehydrogenase
MAEKKARIALVGAGTWSRGWHIPQLVENKKSEFVAVASGRKVPEVSKQYGVPGFENIDALLADPISKTLDGIIIASTHASHFEIGMKCIEAGLNIFMEKPMTTDLPEALKMTKAANASDKIFMVNNTANWRKNAHLATQMVERGDVGEIKHAMVMFATPLGFIFNDPTNVGWNKPSGNMIGNGFAWGQLAHTFGWLWMVSGLKPVEVFAFMGKGSKSDADVYDSASILCSNGATVSVSACGIIPGKKKYVQNRLFGTEGMLSYCGDYEIDEGDAHEEGRTAPTKMEGELRLERFDGKNVVNTDFEFENIEQGGDGPESLKAFIDAVSGDPHFKGTTADIGFLCVATIDAMYRSAKSGKAEPLLPEDMFEEWVAK